MIKGINSMNPLYIDCLFPCLLYVVYADTGSAGTRRSMQYAICTLNSNVYKYKSFILFLFFIFEISCMDDNFFAPSIFAKDEEKKTRKKNNNE